MRLLPERWTIDFWPMRTIVSAYLVVTGGLVALAIITLGSARMSTAPYLAGGSAVGVFFLVAAVLMWIRARGNWIAAAAAAFIGAGAWWLLAYTVLTRHPAPALASAVVFVLMTAVVTLGVLAATLQRAPDEG